MSTVQRWAVCKLCCVWDWLKVEKALCGAKPRYFRANSEKHCGAPGGILSTVQNGSDQSWLLECSLDVPSWIFSFSPLLFNNITMVGLGGSSFLRSSDTVEPSNRTAQGCDILSMCYVCVLQSWNFKNKRAAVTTWKEKGKRCHFKGLSWTCCLVRMENNWKRSHCGWTTICNLTRCCSGQWVSKHFCGFAVVTSQQEWHISTVHST